MDLGPAPDRKPYMGSDGQGPTWTSDLPPSIEQDKLDILQLDWCSQIHHGLGRDDAIGFLVIMHGHHELEPAERVEASLEIPFGEVDYS